MSKRPYEDISLNSFIPVVKRNKLLEIDQTSIDLIVSNFITSLQTETGINQVCEKIIIPDIENRYQKNKHNINNSIGITVYNTGDCLDIYYVDDIQFSLKFSSDIFDEISKYLSIKYKKYVKNSRISVCIYAYLLKQILKLKYHIFEFYDNSDPYTVITKNGLYDGYTFIFYY